MNSIKFDYITIYRVELIYMRNEGMKDKEIGEICNEKEKTVNKWFTAGTQPKANVIELLEKRYFKREKLLIDKLRNPTY